MADKRQSTSDAQPAAVKPRVGVVGHLRSAVAPTLADPFRLSLTLAVNAAIVVGIVGTAIILRNHKPPPKPPTLEAALAALDRGKDDDARQLAARLAAKADITNEEWGVPDFVFGTLAVKAAEAEAAKKRGEAYRKAALYLQRSHERGFPARHEATGLYLMGKRLCLCGRLDDALPVLQAAMREPTEHVTELRSFLITALVGVYPPEIEKALAESQKLLADSKLSEGERGEAVLEQARILFRLDRMKECAATLDKAPGDPLLRGHISLLRGRLALSEGQSITKSGTKTKEDTDKSQAKFQLALDWFHKAISQAGGDNSIARQANYLIGLCLAEQGNLPAALNQMERTAKLYPDSPEYLAALYQQGEFARRMGRHSEAVKAFQQMTLAYTHLDEFHNPWVSVPQIQATLHNACQEYLSAKKYATAATFSRLLARVMPRVEALKLTAQIYRAWGENLMDQAEHLPPQKADERRKAARIELRRAGDTYTELARELFTTREYTDRLWDGATMYMAGHDFRSAANLLRTYLHNEARKRNAQALSDLGEAELSLGETEQSLRWFQACIDQHPRDEAIYRARLLASRAAIARGDIKQAEGFLSDNLNGDQLTPAAKEWRDSLFALGDLLHLAGRDAEAVARLEEALRRYPDAPQAIAARYLLADSSRRLAITIRRESQRRFPRPCEARAAREVRPTFSPLIGNLCCSEMISAAAPRKT